MNLDLQLIKWQLTSSGGFIVTFACADEDEAQKYFQAKTVAKGKQAGQIFSATLTELDDQGNAPGEDYPPVPHVPAPFKGGPIECLLVTQWGKDPLFHEWLEEPNEKHARTAVLALCGILTRKGIDSDLGAVERFRNNIQKPYTAWLRARMAAES